MTIKEIIAYFKENNETLISIAKDENLYNYEKKEIEAVCMRETFEANEKAIQALEQTEWIPVSERLPEAYEFVNCTCHSLIDDREDWVIETVYVPQPSDSPYSDWGNIPMLNRGDCEVVAWMYRDIPEPYKAESEDKE